MAMARKSPAPPASTATRSVTSTTAASTPKSRGKSTAASVGKARKALLSTAESPYYQLWVLSNLTAKPFHKFGLRFHLNLTDWRIMLTVADRPGITAQELSDYSGLDKMSVSRAVRSLEAQGRLVREGNAADRRLRHLELTDEGWAVYTEIAHSARAREAHIHAGLSAADRATLQRLLKSMTGQARLVT
jgi:DNA-binding MarR family transcriptional regulator